MNEATICRRFEIVTPANARRYRTAGPPLTMRTADEETAKKSGDRCGSRCCLLTLCVMLASCASVNDASVFTRPATSETNTDRMRDFHSVSCVAPKVSTSNAAACEIVQQGGGELWVIGSVIGNNLVYEQGAVQIGADGVIKSVGCSDGLIPSEDTVIACGQAVISPGLINSHHHLYFENNQPATWGAERFDHRNDWRFGLNGHTKLFFSPDSESNASRWSRIRQVLSGTTSAVVNWVLDERPDAGMHRDLDWVGNEAGRSVEVDVFPLGDRKVPSHLNGTCEYPEINTGDATRPFSAHIGEGITAAALNEIECLVGLREDAVAITSSTTNFVHAVAISAKAAKVLAESESTVVWSPRSNTSLYGHTAPIPMLRNMGVNVSLSSDWMISGSMNMLREMKCAKHWSERYFDGALSDFDIHRMSSRNAAKAIGMDRYIGTLQPGSFADVAVFAKKPNSGPFASIVDADTRDVLLVLKNGKPVVGLPELVAGLPTGHDCERLPKEAIGRETMVCAKREFGIPLIELVSGSENYYPLGFRGGTPTDEHSCIPVRAGEFTGIPVLNFDSDGDGIRDGVDNCPRVFNAIRPVDAGHQPDTDNDGAGDACDSNPIIATLIESG